MTDERQAGAIEIEVTEEMVSAGVAEFLEVEAHQLSSATLVRRVFLAMLRVHQRTLTSGDSRYQFPDPLLVEVQHVKPRFPWPK